MEDKNLKISLVWPNKDHGMVGIARLPDGLNDFAGKERKYKSLRNVQFNVFKVFNLPSRYREMRCIVALSPIRAGSVLVFITNRSLYMSEYTLFSSIYYRGNYLIIILTSLNF